jgi:hypothetical protein
VRAHFPCEDEIRGIVSQKGFGGASGAGSAHAAKALDAHFGITPKLWIPRQQASILRKPSSAYHPRSSFWTVRRTSLQLWPNFSPVWSERFANSRELVKKAKQMRSSGICRLKEKAETNEKNERQLAVL